MQIAGALIRISSGTVVVVAAVCCCSSQRSNDGIELAARRLLIPIAVIGGGIAI
jgi:hypothetical protein